MRIQHNIMAMSAYRNYNTNTSAVAKNLEKLSSGYKINRAGDDAAGLAISEKMRAQITGLNAATKNVKDGISLVKTAEGAMQEIQDMLNRMDYLATQSANGTYQDEVDREALQKEVNQLCDEINRIADSANFNGIKLLDGSWDTDAVGKAQEAVDAIQAKIDNPTFETVYKDSTSAEVQGKMLAKSTSNDPNSATDGVGLGTILETDYKDGGKPGFSVDLDGMSHVFSDVTDTTNTDDNDASFTLTVDGQAISVSQKDIADAYQAVNGTAAKNGDTASEEVLAKALATKLNGAFTDDAGNTYDVALDGKKLTFTAKDNLDTAPTRHYDVSFNGVAAGTAAPTADVFTTGALTQTGTAGNEDAVATIKYIDKDGKEQTKDVAFKSGATDVASATALIAAINADDDLKGLFTAAGNNTGITLTSKVAGETVKVSEFTIKTAGTDAVAVAAGKNTTEGKDAYTTGTDGYLNAGTEVTVQAGPPAVDQLASTTLTFTANDLKDGTKITLGDKTYTIAIGENSAYKDVEGAVYVDGLKADDTDFLDKICTKLAEVAKDNGTFTVSHQGTDGKIGLKQLQEVKDSTDMSTMDKFASYIGISQVDTTATEANKKAAVDAAKAELADAQKKLDAAAEKDGKELVLQIGDTSDSFNQLGVKIGSMRTEALGVAGLSISTAEDAAAAIDTIKNAINNVSSVRGDLGAYQNRLEHTANNLSVMAENIQDAESSIRDTDIAEEMMSYTKNNILVQSAQAMLAQANQVPQGVLQLLG